MLPPDFIKSLVAKGTNPPYCGWCINAANVQGLELACVKYAVYVFRYSSCSDYQKREGSDVPIVNQEEIGKGAGYKDLRR